MTLLKNPLVALVTTVIALLIFLGLRASMIKTARDTQAVEETREYVNQLKQEVSTLEVKITEAETPLAQEKRLRDELLLQKEGEQVIVLPSTTPVVIPTPSPTSKPKPWQEWRALLLE